MQLRDDFSLSRAENSNPNGYLIDLEIWLGLRKERKRDFFREGFLTFLTQRARYW